MPEKYLGSVTKLRIAAVTDRAAFNPATALTSAVPLFTRSADLSASRESFAFDPEYEENEGSWSEGEPTTSRSWSISFDGYYHPVDPGYVLIENAVWRETPAGVAQGEILYCWYFPIGNAAGMKFYHGFCRPEELGIPSDRGGAVDNSYALNGAGKLNRAVVPAT